jgi:hypothetical protein
MQALLCALALAFLAGTLLSSQPVSAASATTFYGISDSVMLDVGTDTPTDTATDTPTATPTDTPTPTTTPAATATPSNPYALNVGGAAAAAGWPQQYSNWCGVATIALVANYLGSGVSQSSILGMLNNPNNQSQWSYPAPSSSYYGPYVPTDISGDFGTDPRALAEGMTLATGRLYHAKVDVNGAWDTTIHIVRDMLASRQPISVFVDHGMHSVIVAGVDATGDPLSNPNSITAIHVWDPGGGVNMVGIQSAMEAVVPISQWLSGTIPWSGSSYLRYPYAANIDGGKALDPDPAVGPYAYVPAQVNHLWIGHNVYISPLASGDSAGLSPDWELDQYGTLIAGLPSNPWPNIPDGYTGATVAMPANPPPPPPPVKPPKKAPALPPPPPPRPTPTARATLTATALPTATSLPTAAPTATARPQTVCAPLNCALTAIGGDTSLLAVSLLLLLLMVMWFPAAILVARLRIRWRQMAREAMMAALDAGEATTLADLAALPMLDNLPDGVLDALSVDQPGAGSGATETADDLADVAARDTMDMPTVD